MRRAKSEGKPAKPTKRAASDWLRRMADLEDSCDSVTAGRPVDGHSVDAPSDDPSTRLRAALGRLIELSRRTRGLTAAEFAAAHRITMQELVSLERGEDPAPSPRTIRVLAKAAGVSASPLLQLAGCATPIDPELSREALRFMTGPVPDAKLTREEARRFRAFVKVLARPA